MNLDPEQEPYLVLMPGRGLVVPQSKTESHQLRFEGWYPCLAFPDHGLHADQVEIADRLCSVFGGTVTERYGFEEPADKEYWWISIGETTLLLMRKGRIDLLGNGPSDIELVYRISRHCRARCRGWRWRIWYAVNQRRLHD
jgi:hypothetical protein